MAGDGHALKHDPALERWYKMREDMHTRFRITGPTARKGLIWMMFVPCVLGLLAGQSDAKWNWAAKRKGESLQSLTPKESEDA